MHEQDVILMVNFIIENKATRKQTAEKFKINERTVSYRINKSLKIIDVDKYNQVKEIWKKNIEVGKVKGGTISKKTSKLSIEKISIMALDIINNNLSLEEASIKFSIPKSTLYELLNKVQPNIQKQLIILFYNHKKEAFNNKTI